jgi:hypothetical protein
MTRSMRRKRDRIHCPDTGAGSDVDDILKDSNQLSFPIYGPQVKEEGGGGVYLWMWPYRGEEELVVEKQA